MQIWFISSLLFAVLVALFAVMNSEPVTIRLFWAKYEFSQAIVILGSAAVGAIIVGLLGMFQYIRSGLKRRELQNIIKKLENEKEELLIKIATINKESKASAIQNEAEEKQEK